MTSQIVVVLKNAQKELEKSPKQVQIKFAFWVDAVTNEGIEEVKKRPGWRDELLKGERQGQRSIRLNNKWRAFYTMTIEEKIELITVEEITPHDYR